MSLYRTYRPQTFADVIGQDHIVTTLEQTVEKGKLANAYLFAGNRGTGKTSVARILAKVMMTQGIKDETLQKLIAKGVEEGNLVDLLEIDAASNRGIDDIRELVEKIQFSPVVGAAKVYIIDEVHMLTKEAFNALLKTLEEPPEYAYFILATTERNKIPATIQSRCQCFPFRNIRDEDIVRRLQFIADSEKIKADRDALRAIAQHVDGSMRDAISLLDQLRSLPKITREEVEQRVGATGHEEVTAVLQAMETHDPAEIVKVLHTLEEEGIPTDLFLRQILTHMRTKLHEAVEAAQPTAALVATIDQLLDALRDIRTAPLPALVLEAALLSLCQEEESPVAKKGTGKKEKQAPRQKEETKTQEHAAEKEEESASKEAKRPETVEAVELSLEAVREQWPSVLVQVTPPSVRMSLKNGQLTAVDTKKISVAFSSSFHHDKVANAEASHQVEKILEKIFRRALRLECTIEEEEPDNGSNAESVNLAEAAAEIF